MSGDSPDEPKPTRGLTFWSVHCEKGCSMGGWDPNPERITKELALACPFDGTRRARHEEAVMP